MKHVKTFETYVQDIMNVPTGIAEKEKETYIKSQLRTYRNVIKTFGIVIQDNFDIETKNYLGISFNFQDEECAILISKEDKKFYIKIGKQTTPIHNSNELKEMFLKYLN